MLWAPLRKTTSSDPCTSISLRVSGNLDPFIPTVSLYSLKERHLCSHNPHRNTAHKTKTRERLPLSSAEDLHCSWGEVTGLTSSWASPSLFLLQSQWGLQEFPFARLRWAGSSAQQPSSPQAPLICKPAVLSLHPHLSWSSLLACRRRAGWGDCSHKTSGHKGKWKGHGPIQLLLG